MNLTQGWWRHLLKAFEIYRKGESRGLGGAISKGSSKSVLVACLAGIVIGLVAGIMFINLSPTPSDSTGSPYTDWQPNSSQTYQFISEHYYDDATGGFKFTEDSPPSLEATYLALFPFQNRRMPVNPKTLEYVRNYYVPEKQYYLAEGELDEFQSTFMAMHINSWYQAGFNQPINMSWLISLSLLNPANPPENMDLIDQYKVFLLLINPRYMKNSPEELPMLRSKYQEFICNYYIPEGEDWLKTKYFQKVFKSDLRIRCQNEEEIERELINELESFDMESNNDIKKADWIHRLKLRSGLGIYRLKLASGLELSTDEIISELEKFSTKDGGYKEFLKDEDASLTGTYYAQRLMSLLPMRT